MIIQRTFRLQKWDDATKQAMVSFWENRGVIFNQDSGKEMIGYRGSLLLNLVSFNMQNLRTKVTISVNESLECTSSLDICTVGQIITSWNRDYWELEFDTFESMLLSGDEKSAEWLDYRSRAKSKDVAWVIWIFAVVAIVALSCFWGSLLMRSFK